MEGLLALTRGSLGFDFGVGEAAVTLQPFVALVEQLFDFEVADLAQSVAQAALELRRHVLGVAVGAAQGFVNNFVDQPQSLEAVGSDAYTYGGKTVGSVLINRMKVAGA